VAGILALQPHPMPICNFRNYNIVVLLHISRRQWLEVFLAAFVIN
jgi:hypothetical protein